MGVSPVCSRVTLAFKLKWLFLRSRRPSEATMKWTNFPLEKHNAIMLINLRHLNLFCTFLYLQSHNSNFVLMLTHLIVYIFFIFIFCRFWFLIRYLKYLLITKELQKLHLAIIVSHFSCLEWKWSVICRCDSWDYVNVVMVLLFFSSKSFVKWWL